MAEAVASELGVPASAVPEPVVPELVAPASELGAVSALVLVREVAQGLAARGFAART